ncbi:MAG: BamA/TamA family outer membrane protein [Calditrichae bacterium]|nr:BamA/TamA family outer membrane protein [Calditrichia bacterium]
MRFIGLFLLFFGAASGVLVAQNEDAFPVLIERVIVFGNEKTRDEVVLREIPFDFPAELNLEDFQLIQNRLMNLFLFNRVELGIIGQGEGKILTVQLTETWYVYPVPLLFINERDWSKVSYGFSLSHTNFRGMNEQLALGGWLGFNPSFFMRYNNPWLGRNAKFIFGINAFGKMVGNKFFDFDERHIGGGVSLGKRLTLNTSVQLSASVKRVEFPVEFRQFSVSGDRSDVVPQFGLQIRTDKRDLFEYPRNGAYVKWNITRTGLTANQPQFWRFNFDNRVYFKLHNRLSIGGKQLLTFNSVPESELPIYDRIFIGYGNRIRGYFDKILTGRHLMMHHVEARIGLVPIRYLSWENAPVMPVFFQQLKYGLSLGLFVDSGTTWNHSEELSLKNHFTGYGAGLHIHLPYIYLLRIDHAWSDTGDRQWIIEAGVSF